MAARLLPLAELTAADVKALDRKTTCVLLVVSPVEVTRATVAPSPAGDLACRLWTIERRSALGELRRHGLPVLEWRPPEPLEAALVDARRRRGRLANVG